MRFLFGSAVFFFCDSILESVLAVLLNIAFSFSRRRIRVRVLNAERKFSYCVQDDFTRSLKFSSVKETIQKFHSCRKLKKRLVRKRSKPRANIHDEICHKLKSMTASMTGIFWPLLVENSLTLKTLGRQHIKEQSLQK